MLVIKPCVLPVESGICRLRLRRLDFSCNRIAHIPCDIRKVDTLEQLVLNNNPLLSPPANVSL
jgi:Leucine-rich repeat (LRR) protein